jgi:hypothetical protein
MIRRTFLPRRARVLAPALSLAVALLAAMGCSTGDVKLADVPADATEKVKQGQTKPVAKSDRLPPANQQSKGRPY